MSDTAIFANPLLTAVLLVGMLASYSYRVRLRPLFWCLALSCVVLSILEIADIIQYNLTHNVEWDFLCFWIYGRIATLGLNFYDPKNYTVDLLPFDPSDEFKQEIFRVGTHFPPPGMLLMRPLGLLEYHSAMIVWYAGSCAVALAAIYVLWKMFLRRDNMDGFLLAASLTMILHSTASTFYYAQINFLLLLCVLGFWNARADGRAGVFAALGMMLKPIAAGLLLLPLLERKWRTLFISVVAYAAMMIPAFWVFGAKTSSGYFFRNFAGALPHFQFAESINKSLLGIILKLFPESVSTLHPLFTPPFLICGGLLTAASAYLVLHCRQKDDPWALALILCFSLLIYPGTLVHYPLLLLPVVFLVWRAEELEWNTAARITIVTTFYLLVNLREGRFVFFAIAFMWMCSAWAILQKGRRAAGANS